MDSDANGVRVGFGIEARQRECINYQLILSNASAARTALGPSIQSAVMHTPIYAKSFQSQLSSATN